MRIIYLLIILFLSTPIFSQENQKFNKSDVSRRILSSFEKEAPNDTIASDYIELADKLFKEADYVKAESYLLKAKSMLNPRSDKEKIAEIDRKLAQTLEAQTKYDEAVNSYLSASQLTSDKILKEVNSNDVERLNNIKNPMIQVNTIQRNIDLLQGDEKREERVVAYGQMAEINRTMQNNSAAISNLETALKEVGNSPREQILLEQKIAEVYESDDQPEKAIQINQKLVEQAKQINDPQLEIKQMVNLSSNYQKVGEDKNAQRVLEEAYKLAISKNQTIEAGRIVQLMVAQYYKQKTPDAALNIYTDFLNKLDTLVKSDSTLIESKFFQLQESRIAQLEKEKILRDNLIKKQNILNYGLISGILLITLFLVFIVRALYSIKKKNKKIALQSLRREMNPHFIFNSLNSVNQFIADNNELEANKYLTSYSRLMRNILENSNKDFVSLTTEIEQLKEYLELEYLRFHDKFRYEISINEKIDTDTLFIPNMLIQPLLENAIWHGLRYKDKDGVLQLTADMEKKNIKIIVSDNGIGMIQSNKLKTEHQKKNISLGISNTKERIKLLNDLYHMNISMTIINKEEPETGVIVYLYFPILDKS